MKCWQEQARCVPVWNSAGSPRESTDVLAWRELISTTVGSFGNTRRVLIDDRICAWDFGILVVRLDDGGAHDYLVEVGPATAIQCFLVPLAYRVGLAEDEDYGNNEADVNGCDVNGKLRFILVDDS